MNYYDNDEYEIFNAINDFLKSLDKKKWINYGIEYNIDKQNFASHGIVKGLNLDILKVRRKIYFDPSFIKKYPTFI